MLLGARRKFGEWFVERIDRCCLLGKGSLDLLGGLLLGDAVLGGDEVGETVLVAGNGLEVLGRELVEGLTDLVLGCFVGHGDGFVVYKRLFEVKL